MDVISYLIMSILIIILLLLFDYVKHIQFYIKAAKIPGPKTLSIIGNAHSFIGKDSAEAYSLLMDIYEHYPSPSRLWLANQLWIGIYEAEQLNTVLKSSKTLAKSDFYNFSRLWFGNGLIRSPVSTWRVHRKLIQPFFNPQILRSFVGIFDNHAKIIIDKMEAEVEEDEFKIAPYLTAFTINIALESTMGLTETSDSETCKKYIKCVESGLELLIKRLLRVWLHPDIIFNCTRLSKEYYKSIKQIHSIINSILQKKKMELLEDNNNEIDGTTEKRKGFLDRLLELRDMDKLSDQDICDEVNTLIVGAFETFSLSLQYVMLILASYPDIQEKVYKELHEIYGEESPENLSVTFEDLKRMEYTERVIQETLRLFTPLPIILRKVEEDLEIGEYTLPKDSTIVCAFGKIHRDKKYWPDPLKFDPDRFLPEEVAKRNPNCYLPFSGGPRNCIGFVFAMMEMKTFVATIVRKFLIKKEHIQPIKDIKQKVDVLAQPAEPITIKIVKRFPNSSNN